MRKLLLITFLLICQFAKAQTPVPMASQAGLTYTENFASIAGWANNFASGTRAAPFKSVPVNATGTIPDGIKTTTSTATFSTGTSGGVQKGTQNIQLLSTGTAENSTAVAIDFLVNFSGVNAGNLSFNWAVVNNSTGNRNASLRVYTSIDGTNFTELTSAQVLNFTNNVAGSGNINVALPSAFNNVSSAVIRFYYHNGTSSNTASGSRPKISIDDLTVTATSLATTPTLNANATAFSFGSQNTGTSSAAQNYTLGGSNLTSNVSVNATIPYEISKNGTTFSTSISFTATEAMASPTVYVRFSPTANGLANGTLTNASNGATDVNISLSGTGVTGDVTPPTTAATYPKRTAVTTTSVDFANNINEAGTTYYVLALAGGTTPTPAQVKAAQDGTGSAALKSGSFTNIANTDASASISGLAVGTAYTLYVVAQDNAGNLQTTVASIDATTANPPLVSAPVIISQYYEGTSVNKWIELTNLSNAPINTASPQLKLALYNISGDAGNINITGTPSQIVNLNFTIPANGTVLLGNTGNGTEVPYLTPASAIMNNNLVINFNGNDGVALLDANNNIIDAFGQGVNAKDVSYVRSLNVTAPSPTYIDADWTRTPLATVQNAIDDDDPDRLGVHFPPNLPVCAAPSTPATALNFSNVTTGSITASFTKSTDANEYLIIRSLNATLSAVPVDGTAYAIGSALGGGTVINKIVTNTFTDNGLTSSTTYNYFIVPLNNLSCTGGPKYLTTSILTASQATKALLPCTTPSAQPTNFAITASNYNFIQASFTASASTDEYLVVMSTNSTLTATPTNQTIYNVGDQLGGGIVVKRGIGTSFTRNNLTQNTNYYFFIYAVNSACSGGPLYLTAQPLLGNFKTGVLDVNKLNFYYGNLHSHSSYSDGNKDDLTKKPEDDYAFAKTAMKMDFLGISEHNHTQAGMSLANWQPGIDAAKNATTSTFVAMHGMEWGVISGGGHVIVYGIDSLIGWEPGENQIYVPKSTYTGPTGLFRMINRHGLNAIATLAHPNTTDFNNISATYDLSADSAIVGTALESGPAFSTNVTYSDPASSMSYLSYYNRMLARGYHLGANIDHDNHNLTFGKHTRSRLVVLAPALTENDLLDAIKKMRFYASQDSAAKVVFTINKQPVGSIFKTSGAPEIAVGTITTSPVTSIKILYGTPGSGVNPVELTTSTSSTLSYTDNALANLATGYYYADIVEADGSRIITSPIWYTRDDSTVKKDQNITFAATRQATYGDPDLTAGATSDNTGINITYTSSDTDIATINNNDIHILKAGTVTITANQPGDTFFNPATPKQQVLTISPKTITVTADAKTKVEGTIDPMFTYIATPMLLGADSFTGALTRDAGETSGDYAIQQGTLALNTNYVINYRTANLHIYARPTTSLSGNISVPVNATSPVITFTASTGTAPFTFTYNINGGADQTLTTTTNTATVSVPTNTLGTFVYTVTSITDAYSTQTQNISTTIKINPIPVASITGTTALCLNGTAPNITFTGSNGTAPFTFIYNINGGTNQTITTNGTNSSVTVAAPTNTAGTYNYNLVSVSDVNAGQAQTGTATITVRSLATATIAGTATTAVNATAPVVTFTGANGTAPYTFTYNMNGGTNQTITTTSGNSVTLTASTATAGTFNYNLLSVSDANCSQPQTGTATIVVNPLPVGNISGTTAVCQNAATPNLTFTATVGTAPFTFTYNINGGTNRTITTTSGNSVTLAAPTNATGTFAYNLISIADANASQAQTSTATVTIRTLATASISGSTAVIVNATAPLITFTGANGTAPYTFTYNINGGTNKTVTTTSGNSVTVAVPTNAAGTFAYNLVNVSDANCGQAQTGTATVIVRPLPTATLAGNAQVCLNGTSPVVTFTGAAGTAPYTFTYTINGGANRTITSNNTTATLNAPTNTAGTFVYALVNVADAYTNQAQSGTATVVINAMPALVITSNTSSAVVSKGTSIVLSASGASTYTWSPLTDVIAGQGSANLTIRPKQTTTYTVTGTNASGCTTTQSITIQVQDDYQVKALNIMSPNGDGKNDKFVIQNIDYYPNNTLTIFDRSGRKVYTKKGYANEWDGTYNGTPLASDTYYYILEFGTNITPFKGYITIVRN
ncbi:gliding motility-associated C-terminal domain-containing protein [Pedobacter sp. KR3-3]|uniref:Gliding motility-associated C-terminal domain-containing protein n=1 Tax=Pedobacter albus TaxID=3113905 RepID=A0ABU7I3D9_9SPHI|nr:gliding motility-associated C-terminal domain-containing protein [Pedobacter sp. KR3-3]MEE1943826.1 gliding motility-associated C-terminal domain-containing protein [Pedobacter sp. KR3-3]